MEEEYKITFNIYKDEKIKLIEQIKNFKGDNETKTKLLHNLAYIDEMLEKYTSKITKGKSFYI